MTKSTARRVVVLRDIPSNIVEEAIFVLKNEEPDCQTDLSERTESTKDFILMKEAQSIIENYIEKRNSLAEDKNKKKSRPRWHIDLLINMGIVMAISALVYMMIKIF